MIESIVIAGKPLDGDVSWVVEFTADGRFTLRMGGEVPGGRYKTDRKADPPALDLTDTPENQRREDPPILGIYKVEGDTLTVCLKPGAVRPDTFDAEARSGNILVVMKRAKPE